MPEQFKCRCGNVSDRPICPACRGEKPDEPTEWHWQQFWIIASSLVHRRAPELQYADQDDLTQEMCVHFRQAYDTWDPGLSPWKAFCRIAMRSRFHSASTNYFRNKHQRTWKEQSDAFHGLDVPDRQPQPLDVVGRTESETESDWGVEDVDAVMPDERMIHEEELGRIRQWIQDARECLTPLENEVWDRMIDGKSCLDRSYDNARQRIRAKLNGKRIKDMSRVKKRKKRAQ